MAWAQTITPNPDIPCQPGWCLQYVRQAFGLPARYGSATEAWEKSTSQHRDRNFPPGVWHAVYYALANEPLGHVVLRAPDGSCYSTSDLDNTPHHHPDLADLERFYAYYGMTLTYRGWTEDVTSYRVIEEEDDMPTIDELLDAKVKREGPNQKGETSLRGVLAYIDTLTDPARILDAQVKREGGALGGHTSLRGVLAYFDAAMAGVIGGTITGVLRATPGASPDEIAAAVQAAVAGSLSGAQITFKVAGDDAN